MTCVTRHPAILFLAMIVLMALAAGIGFRVLRRIRPMADDSREQPIVDYRTRDTGALRQIVRATGQIGDEMWKMVRGVARDAGRRHRQPARRIDSRAAPEPAQRGGRAEALGPMR
ncbi:hypothetical protein AB4120_13575 [Cupriavidus sp. 2KB_3]|uniref:hypothetical protein n=1 Tax=Cupriavidus TaxID=106589 RepID=UPI0021CCDD8A|nr:hypothetical protein [Cupriavidus campinensis]